MINSFFNCSKLLFSDMRLVPVGVDEVGGEGGVGEGGGGGRNHSKPRQSYSPGQISTCRGRRFFNIAELLHVYETLLVCLSVCTHLFLLFYFYFFPFLLKL